MSGSSRQRGSLPGGTNLVPSLSAAAGGPSGIDAGCLVFCLSTAPDGGDGSIGRPFNTLQDGVDKLSTLFDPANFSFGTLVSCGGTFVEHVTSTDIPLFFLAMAPTIWSHVGGFFLTTTRVTDEAPLAFIMDSTLWNGSPTSWILFGPGKGAIVMTDISATAFAPPFISLRNVQGIGLDISTGIVPALVGQFSMCDSTIDDFDASLAATPESSKWLLSTMQRSSATTMVANKIGQVERSFIADLSTTGMNGLLGDVTSAVPGPIGFFETVLQDSIVAPAAAGAGTIDLFIDATTRRFLTAKAPAIDAAFAFDDLDGFAIQAPGAIGDWAVSVPVSTEEAINRIAAAYFALHGAIRC
jgi:hypothetical protein